MNKFIVNIFLDGLLWLSILVYWIGLPGVLYAERFIVFFLWVNIVFGIIAALIPKGEITLEAMIAYRDSHRYHKIYNSYSWIFEALAVAAIGFTFTAFVYILGCICFMSHRQKIREALSEISEDLCG